MYVCGIVCECVFVCVYVCVVVCVYVFVCVCVSMCVCMSVNAWCVRVCMCVCDKNSLVCFCAKAEINITWQTTTGAKNTSFEAEAARCLP